MFFGKGLDGINTLGFADPRLPVVSTLLWHLGRSSLGANRILETPGQHRRLPELKVTLNYTARPCLKKQTWGAAQFADSLKYE